MDHLLANRIHHRRRLIVTAKQTSLFVTRAFPSLSPDRKTLEKEPTLGSDAKQFAKYSDVAVTDPQVLAKMLRVNKLGGLVVNSESTEAEMIQTFQALENAFETKFDASELADIDETNKDVMALSEQQLLTELSTIQRSVNSNIQLKTESVAFEDEAEFQAALNEVIQTNGTIGQALEAARKRKSTTGDADAAPKKKARARKPKVKKGASKYRPQSAVNCSTL